jgi:hypothetical protein
MVQLRSKNSMEPLTSQLISDTTSNLIDERNSSSHKICEAPCHLTLGFEMKETYVPLLSILVQSLSFLFGDQPCITRIPVNAIDHCMGVRGNFSGKLGNILVGIVSPVFVIENAITGSLIHFLWSWRYRIDLVTIVVRLRKELWQILCQNAFLWEPGVNGIQSKSD